jgi:hypothetical protein
MRSRGSSSSSGGSLTVDSLMHTPAMPSCLAQPWAVWSAAWLPQPIRLGGSSVVSAVWLAGCPVQCGHGRGQAGSHTLGPEVLGVPTRVGSGRQGGHVEPATIQSDLRGPRPCHTSMLVPRFAGKSRAAAPCFAPMSSEARRLVREVGARQDFRLRRTPRALFGARRDSV